MTRTSKWKDRRKASAGAAHRRAAAVIAIGLITGAWPRPAPAGEARTLCVYDPSGSSGDAARIMLDYKIEAASWGVDFSLQTFTDELVAAEGFKAGRCDAVFLSGVRARRFTPFSGTLEAIGALPSYGDLEKAIAQIAAPENAEKVRHGSYETAAVFPAGAAYLFVRSRSMRSIEQLAGKRIATLEFDRAAKALVQEAGANMRVVDISTFAKQFNNGAVDACYAPATAYGPMELNKGLGTGGGILRYPLAQVTFQLLLHSDRFPAGFAARSRQYAGREFKAVQRVIDRAERSIPARQWVEVLPSERKRYEDLFQEVRIRLRDQENEYDAAMLQLMRKLRCASDGTRAECAARVE